MRGIAFISVLLMLPSLVMGATYYAEPKGSLDLDNNTTATGDGSAGNPWSIGQAMVEAEAGDTVIFSSGTYYAGYSNSTGAPYYNPSNSGIGDSDSQRIIFRSASGAASTIIDGQSGEYLKSYVIGAALRDYITIDGFTVSCNGGTYAGEMAFHNEDSTSTGNTIKNCIFDGGSTGNNDTNNFPGLWLQGQEYFSVENCVFYGYREVNNYWNTAAIIGYHNQYGTIKNNEIYDCTVGIMLKSGQHDMAVAYNYIHDCHQAIAASPNLEVMESHRATVYHNVLANCSFSGLNVAGDSGYHANSWTVYNNTVYATSRGICLFDNDPGYGWNIYNNIVVNMTNSPLESLTSKHTSEYITCDHNQWGTSLKITHHLYEADQAVYTTLSGWQSSSKLADGGNPGTGSLASDTLFVNSSGSMNTLADFALQAESPCKAAGRDGADMGADVSLVGVSQPGRKIGGNPPR